VPPPTSIGAGWLSLVDSLFADLIELGWSHEALARAKVEDGGLAIRLDGMKPQFHDSAARPAGCARRRRAARPPGHLTPWSG
jgi:hypothetical protein